MQTAGMLAAAMLTGCGDAPDPSPPAAAPVVQRWNVLPATPTEQARYALDRLIRGAVPQDLLVIPNQHTHVLRGAKNDLLALPVETLRLLAEPALIERLTSPAATDLNPLHNVLEVLGALPQPDPGLVRRWVAPVAHHADVTLLLLAVGCIQAAHSPELADLALMLLERGAQDKRVSREAFQLLAGAAPPWPQRAAQVVLARGSPFAWLAVAASLEPSGERGVAPTARSDLLAWWALLAEQAGPRIPTGLPRVKTLPYVSAFAKPQTAAVTAGTWQAPSRLGYDLGWLTVIPDQVAEQPLLALFGTGQEPAALARCTLARHGSRAAVLAVHADRACPDELRRLTAEHCMLPGDERVRPESAMTATEEFLAGLRRPRAKPWNLAEVTAVRAGLPPASTPEAVALLQRVIREARPLADLMSVVEEAHDRLRAEDRGLDQAAVFELLGAGEAPDPEARGLGVHLAQRARQAVYLPRLLALEGAAPELARAVNRAMFWIVTGSDVPRPTLEAYVRRYAEQLDQASDEVLPTLATGLLDLGEPGVAALVARIHGPRAVLYARALLQASGVLPLSVAEALCARIDARLHPEARRELYLALWRGAPAEASGALAAAKARIEPAERPVLDVVLQAVRHRAARPPG